METFQVTLSVRERVRKAREDKELKQSEFALIMGVGRTTVSAWETGDRIPDFDTAKKIAHHTGKPWWWLMGFDSLEAATSTTWYRGRRRSDRVLRAGGLGTGPDLRRAA